MKIMCFIKKPLLKTKILNHFYKLKNLFAILSKIFLDCVVLLINILFYLKLNQCQ